MDKREVLEIVDVCFHYFASNYRIEAKHKAIELIDKLQDAKGKNLPIHDVIVSANWTCEKCGRVPNEQVTYEETHQGCGASCH